MITRFSHSTEISSCPESINITDLMRLDYNHSMILTATSTVKCREKSQTQDQLETWRSSTK